jgi:hypothetical protein
MGLSNVTFGYLASMGSMQITLLPHPTSPLRRSQPLNWSISLMH